jgi:hypothetical protein
MGLGRGWTIYDWRKSRIQWAAACFLEAQNVKVPTAMGPVQFLVGFDIFSMYNTKKAIQATGFYQGL